MQPTTKDEDFLKYLYNYEFKADDGEEQVSYKVLDCAYDLFCALKALAHNHNGLKAQLAQEKEAREDLQRAIRLYCVNALTKDELIKRATSKF